MYVSTLGDLTKPLMVKIESGRYNVRMLKDDVGIGYVLCLENNPIEGMKNLTKAFFRRANDPGFEHFDIDSRYIEDKYILRLVRNHFFKYLNVKKHHIELLAEFDDSCYGYESEPIIDDYSVEELRFTFITLMLKTKMMPAHIPIIFYLNVKLTKKDLKRIRIFNKSECGKNDRRYVFWRVFLEETCIGMAIQQSEILNYEKCTNDGGVVAYSVDKEKAYAIGNCMFNDKDFNILIKVAMYNESLLYNRQFMYDHNTDTKIEINRSVLCSNMKVTDNKHYSKDIEKKIIDLYVNDENKNVLFNNNYFLYHSINNV